MTVKTPCTVEPDLWYSQDPDDQYEAITACGFCPIRTECRTYGNDELGGVWGGRLMGNHGRPVVQPVEKQCASCGYPFVARQSRAKFCTKKCQDAASNAKARVDWTAHATKMCPVCGDEFTPRSASAVYCCKEHRAVAKKQRREAEAGVGGERLRALVAEWEPLQVAS